MPTLACTGQPAVVPAHAGEAPCLGACSMDRWYQAPRAVVGCKGDAVRAEQPWAERMDLVEQVKRAAAGTRGKGGWASWSQGLPEGLHVRTSTGFNSEPLHPKPARLRFT